MAESLSHSKLATRVRLPRAVVDRVEAAAVGAYPNEFCGVLLGRFRSIEMEVLELFVTPNVADESIRSHFFEIDPKVLLHVERLAEQRGLAVVGFVHSHPDHPAEPSKTDLERAWPSYVYLIASVDRAGLCELKAYQLDEVRGRFAALAIDPLE